MVIVIHEKCIVKGNKMRANSKLNPDVTPSSGIEPGQHRWEVSAHTTAPSLLPKGLKKLSQVFRGN